MAEKNTKPAKSDKNPASALKGESGEGGSTLAPPKNLAEAKIRVQLAVPYIRKRGTMSGGGSYKFVRDTDVIAMLRGPMCENLITLAGPVAIENETYDEITTGQGRKMNRTKAKFRFQLKFAPTGETEDVVALGIGTDSLDKDANKAMAAGRKYALLLGFNLTTGDDPDSFDEEGNHNGEEEDDRGKLKKPEGQQEKKEQPKKEEKKEEQKSAAGLPANGQELHARLLQYDEKLSKEKLCAKGDLLSHVTAAGVKAGYSANMTEWTGPAIPFAAEAVKGFEQAKRTAKPEEKKEGPPKQEQKAEPPKEQPKQEQKPANTVPASDPNGKPAQSPANTVPPGERYNRRIAGMNASGKLANLDAFRAKYTQDAEMSTDQKAQLEKCYWENRERITGEKNSGEPVAE